jgi:membrane-associated phospholipid phosphatase
MMVTACSGSLGAQSILSTEPGNTVDLSRAGGLEPEAGEWKTWVIASGSAVRPPEPPSLRQSRVELEELRNMPRDAAAVERMKYWNAGAPVMRWLEIAAVELAAARLSNNRGARMRALLTVAAYDATIAAWDSKYTHMRLRPAELDRRFQTLIPTPDSPSYPSEHAAVAGAAAAVLSYVFPDRAAYFAQQAEAAAQSRLVAGVHFRSDVTAGLALGRAVGAMVVERAKADGSDVQWSGVVPKEKGRWSGTNPIEPTFGTWRTFVLASGSQLRPGPPPAFDSAQMATELAEVKNVARTFAATEAAMYWQGTRYGFYVPITTQKIAETHWDMNPPRAARAYALMSVAGYDAAVACWDAKFTYWAIRPNQLDPAVTTLFPNPNHPSYPSAHGCYSGAADRILSYLFPADADAFRAQAKEAGDSRLWAGIHFRSDIDAGLALGRAVGDLVIERARQDGSQ